MPVISVRIPNLEVNDLYKVDDIEDFLKLYSLYDYKILHYYHRYVYAFRATFDMNLPIWTIDNVLYHKIGEYKESLDIGGFPTPIFKCLSVIDKMVGKLIAKMNRRSK